MEWLLSGGEILAGAAALAGWWLVVSFLGRRAGGNLTNMSFVLLPSLMLLWLVGGVVLVLRGFGAV